MRAQAIHGRTGHRSEAMGRESVWRLLFRFSGPAIISQLVFSSYNLVDAIFIGRLGPEAVAAMAVVSPLLMIFMAIGMGTGIGASSLIGRRLGAGNREEANRVFCVAITVTLALSLTFVAICLPNLNFVLGILGAKEGVLSKAYTYASILVAFTTIHKLSIVITSMVRAEGEPILSSAAQIASALFNIITDPIFIFGWGPIPAYGITGAAVTTAASWGVAIAVCAIYFFTGRSQFRFKPSYFIPDFKIIRDIYRVGFASIIRMSIGSTVQTMGNRIAVSFGVIALAVKGVLLRAVGFAFMPTMGIGTGALPLIAYNYGARQKGRVGEIILKAGSLGFIWGTFCFVLVQLFPGQLMSVFGNDPEFLAYGATAVRIFSLAFFTVGVQMILSHYFQGVGEGLASLVGASSRQIIFLLPAMYIMPSIFGVTGLWLAFPAADLLSIIVTVIWANFSFKKNGITLTWHAKPEVAAGPAVIPQRAPGELPPLG